VATKIILRHTPTASEAGAPAYNRASSTQGASAQGGAVTVSGQTSVLLGSWVSDVFDEATSIDGVININIWGSESGTSVNARFRVDFLLYRGGFEQSVLLSK
jgi:hypothetical protein